MTDYRTMNNPPVIYRKRNPLPALLLAVIGLLTGFITAKLLITENNAPQKEVIYIPQPVIKITDDDKGKEKVANLDITNNDVHSGTPYTEIFIQSNNLVDNFGNTYGNAYRLRANDASVYVTVNGDYRYIKGTFAIMKDSASVFNHFVIYAYDEDGTQIYKSETIDPSHPEPLDICIKVSGCKTVRIKFSGYDRFFNSLEVISTGLYFSNSDQKGGSQ